MLCAAQAYNAQHATKEISRGTRHSVYNSTVYHQYTENNICENYNIDSSISHLNTNNDNKNIA